MILKIKKLHPDAIAPTRTHPTDLGYDLYALEATRLYVNHTKQIRTGIAVRFPEGWGGILKDRSSMANRGIAGSGGVIDSGYTGEISVMLTYTTSDAYRFPYYDVEKGDRISQMIPTKVVNWDVVEVNDLGATDREGKAFGSSGK